MGFFDLLNKKLSRRDMLKAVGATGVGTVVGTQLTQKVEAAGPTKPPVERPEYYGSTAVWYGGSASWPSRAFLPSKPIKFPSNCRNCGAPLDPPSGIMRGSYGDRVKCHYCGTWTQGK